MCYQDVIWTETLLVSFSSSCRGGPIADDVRCHHFGRVTGLARGDSLQVSVWRGSDGATANLEANATCVPRASWAPDDTRGRVHLDRGDGWVDSKYLALMDARKSWSTSRGPIGAGAIQVEQPPRPPLVLCARQRGEHTHVRRRTQLQKPYLQTFSLREHLKSAPPPKPVYATGSSPSSTSKYTSSGPLSSPPSPQSVTMLLKYVST
jgi:hypothetical protein